MIGVAKHSLALIWERLPQGRTLDFIGVNYYTRDFVKNTGFSLPGLLGYVCTLDHHRAVGRRNELGWEVYPEGTSTGRCSTTTNGRTATGRASG